MLVGQGASDTIYGGSSVGDQITVNSQAALVYGGPGHDTITAGDGNDTIYAGAGGAVVHAGSGDDLIEGGAGNDALYAPVTATTRLTAAGVRTCSMLAREPTR